MVSEKKVKKRKSRCFFCIFLILALLLLDLLFLFHLKKEIKDVDKRITKMKVTKEAKASSWKEETGQEKQQEEEQEREDGEPPEEETSENREEDESFITEMEKPLRRTREESLAKLEESAGENTSISEILSRQALYSDKMLEALANNPEMAEFVENYPEEKGNVSGGLTEEEKQQDFPLFLQWDSRWGYADYGESCIGLSGCGPTCLSMVLYYLTGDSSLTPDQIAAFSMDHGYYVSGAGTAWSLMKDFPALYGVSVSEHSVNKKEMENQLKQGKLIICSVGEGDFTVYGHFIVIYGYNEEGFLVNDPNCMARSKKIWSFQEIEPQIKNIWSFGKTENQAGNVRLFGDEG